MRGSCWADWEYSVRIGFLPCLVVRRKLWNEVVATTTLAPYHNAWLLVYIIGQMLRRSPEWLYIHTFCVRYRSGNDSFIKRLGTYKRQLITHVAFEKIVADLFGKGSLVYRNVLNTLISDRMGRSLAVLKAGGASLGLQWDLLRLYLKQYWRFPRLWIQVLPVFLIPNAALRLLRTAYFWSCGREMQPPITVQSG